MLRVENLNKSYGSFRVLRDLSFAVNQGSIVGLAGPNACGKTTLIKSILGLVIPDSGRIYVGDLPVTRGYSYRENIGYMQQNAEFPANLRPIELFKLLQSLRRSRPTELGNLLSVFGLEPFLQKPFSTLSAGTRQKIAAVAALMFSPPLLILDEPTAGLDPVSCAHLKKLLLQAANKGTTILIVSHIMSELEQLVSDLVFILEGSILFSGDVSSLREKTNTQTLEAGIVHLLERKEEGEL